MAERVHEVEGVVGGRGRSEVEDVYTAVQQELARLLRDEEREIPV